MEKDITLQSIGYARVSTTGQTLETQIEQLKASGCSKIFQEKVSGAKSDRKELMRMLKNMEPHHQITVTRIDRLARSTFDLFAIVKQICDAGASFKSIAEPWADTATSSGRLMIAVLGGLADLERDLIRTRTAEGRARAKAQGKSIGRKPKLSPDQMREAARRRAEGESYADIARSFNVTHTTIMRIKKKWLNTDL